MGKSSWGVRGHSSGSGVALISASITSVPACPDCGRERSAPGWKVQSIPRGIKYVSRGFGTLCPLYGIVAGSWSRRLCFVWSVNSVCVVSFKDRVVRLSLACSGLRFAGAGTWVRFHASGGRSCKGWRAQSTPRGVQCISSDASLFTVGNSSRVRSSTFRLNRTRRPVVVQFGTDRVLGFRAVSGTWARRYKVSLVEYSTCPGT